MNIRKGASAHPPPPPPFLCCRTNIKRLCFGLRVCQQGCQKSNQDSLFSMLWREFWHCPPLFHSFAHAQEHCKKSSWCYDRLNMYNLPWRLFFCFVLAHQLAMSSCPTRIGWLNSYIQWLRAHHHQPISVKIGNKEKGEMFFSIFLSVSLYLSLAFSPSLSFFSPSLSFKPFIHFCLPISLSNYSLQPVVSKWPFLTNKSNPPPPRLTS